MKKYIKFALPVLFLTLLFLGLIGKSEDNGEKIYLEYCATCHGDQFQGGLGKSLVDGKWEYGSQDADIVRNIREGIPQSGMPAFDEVLSDSDINDLVSYLKEKEQALIRSENTKPEYNVLSTVNTFDYTINIELVTDEVEEPWAIDFISPKKALVTEKPGSLRILENGKMLKEAVSGLPKVFYFGQGGLLDVAIDPEYEKNGWIYLSFSHEIDGKGMTKVIRGKLDGTKWVNEETLFAADEKFYLDTKYHFGSRIVFDKNGYLYFSIGDRGRREQAQDLTVPNGKIHRIYRDGRIPEDNPFFSGNEDNYKTIFAYGSRNAQGLAFDPETGDLWETEHGQKGGDELNIIRSGKNYGWDKITYGRNYDGTVSTGEVKMPGMEVPILFWRPSIAVCGLDFYKGDLFSKWRNHLIVGALKYEEVRLLDIEDNRVIHQETILEKSGRVRDVCSAPDGAIYVVLNNPDKIVRLMPKN